MLQGVILQEGFEFIRWLLAFRGGDALRHLVFFGDAGDLVVRDRGLVRGDRPAELGQDSEPRRDDAVRMPVEQVLPDLPLRLTCGPDLLAAGAVLLQLHQVLACVHLPHPGLVAGVALHLGAFLLLCHLLLLRSVSGGVYQTQGEGDFLR